MVTGFKKVLWILTLIAGIILVLSIVFRSKSMIKMEDHPYIASIDMTMGQDGETHEYSLSQGEISDELNDALISLFLNAKMRNTLLGPPQIYSVTDDSVWISIKISLDTFSIRVNLSTKSEYNYAQCGETNYRIVGYEKLYQNVYDLITDAYQCR